MSTSASKKPGQGSKPGRKKKSVNQNSSPLPSPKKSPARKSFQCPIKGCNHITSTFQNLKVHLNSHIRKNDEWPKEEKDKYFEKNFLSVCPHCKELAGNAPGGKSKGIHNKCEKEFKKRINVILENEIDETENISVEGSPSLAPTDTSENLKSPENKNRERTQFEEITIKCKKSLEEIALSCVDVPTIKLTESLTPGYADCLHLAFDCIRKASTEVKQWKLLIAINSLVLIDDGLSGRRNKKKKGEATKRRFDLFLNGDLDALYEEQNEIMGERKRKWKNKPNMNTFEEEARNLKNAIKRGDPDKGLRNLRSSGKTDLSDPANVEELKSKFPPGEGIGEFDKSKFEDPLIFSPAEVMAKIKAMRKGAPGMSKMSAEILFKVFSYDRSLIEKYTDIINYLSAAETPKELHENLVIRGLSLQKKPKGQRPIGIPEIHDRIVSGLYMDRKKKELNEAYTPLQQALNPRGAEIVVHSMRAHIERFGSDPNWVLLLIDFMNAFNLMQRKTFLKEMIDVIPEMAKYLLAEYTSDKKMVFDNVVIMSKLGLIQGKPEGPTACAANENPLLQDIVKFLDSDHMALALMDDISIVAPQEVAIKVLEFVETEGPKYGFHLNKPKTNVLPLSLIHGIKPSPKSPNWPKEINWIQSEGIEIGGDEDGTRELGSYLGKKPYVEKQVIKKIDEKLKPLAKVILGMNDSHCAWEAIKRLPAIIGLDYIFRTTPPELLGGACEHYDKEMRKLFEMAIIGKNLSDEEWEMAQLPAPVGWGMTPAWAKSIAGYTASLNSNMKEIQKVRNDLVAPLELKLNEMVGIIKSHLPKEATFSLTSTTKQKDIVEALLKKLHVKFAEHMDIRVRILYKQQNDRKAQAIKTNTIRPGMLMETAEFETYARRSLGVDLVSKPVKCLLCEGMFDKKGDHDCMKKGAIIKRHNVVRDLYLKTAREGLVECKGENTIQLKDSKISSYRADMTLDEPIPWCTSKKTALDFTFHNAMAQSYQKTAEKQEGALAELAEKEKNGKYELALKKNNWDFLPLGLEAMGHSSDNCKDVANYLIARKTIQKGVPFTETASEFWHNLSFLIHRQVSRNILNRYRRVSYQHDEEDGEKEEDEKTLNINNLSINNISIK